MVLELGGFKWTFALLIGLCTGLVGFFNSLAVENISGFKLLLTSDLLLDKKSIPIAAPQRSRGEAELRLNEKVSKFLVIHSASGDTGPLSKELSSETKLPQEPQMHHHHIDHNMESIFLHVLADTMGSVGVVILTLLIKYKGWLIADPASSIFISVLIIASVIPLLRNSAEILLQKVPRVHEQDLKVALGDVMRIKGVYSVQNLHVWSFTDTDVVGTLHLHVSTETDKDSTKAKWHIYSMMLELRI
ncbi:hypothetical protein NE237_033094 [Protea cynaroides]|uniref:Cation efflux protein transmembrane domain-containing protein n=1 Tax=Protea cynaroides TaxID=273540 RepID=A0A9Q0R461_9MAGN|nr:hypothetical protein NE237_033094 [Protea cynaroides]